MFEADINANMKNFTLILLASASISSLAAERELTSIDLYCETMVVAFVETALDYKTPSSPEQEKRIAVMEKETLDHCKSMPAVGASKKVKDMTPEQRSILTCVALAEGAAAAKASAKNDAALYTKLQRSRMHFEAACRSNRKQFLHDMKTRGPEYTLGVSY